MKRFLLMLTPYAPTTYFSFRSRNLETLLKYWKRRLTREYSVDSWMAKSGRARIYEDRGQGQRKLVYDSLGEGR